MIRLLFLAHRYLGIAVGLIMLIWTLSGIIMMYQEYPELDDKERRALLAPLQLEDCCASPVEPVFSELGFDSAALEMLAGFPVLRVDPVEQLPITYDLRSGRPLDGVDAEFAGEIAREFAARQFAGFDITLDATIHNDQWTVYGAYNPHRPLYRYQVNDPASSQFYLSSRSGEVIQLTTRRERVWGYLGAVIHWLYPTVLRQHTTVWAQTVIWLTVLGIFLTSIGLYLGIRQFRRRPTGPASPYKGFALWHHYSGLVFGLLTLTWVVSGLFSMNPWGWLEGESAAPEARRLQGQALNWQDISSTLNTIQNAQSGQAVSRYQMSAFDGELQLVAFQGADDGTRLNTDNLQTAPLGRDQLAAAARALQPGRNIASTAMLEQGDAYYYDHHEARQFPVFRVIYGDDENRRYYLSPVNGELLRKVDQDVRWYRWLHYGLHRGDFTALLRSRPFWDVFMVVFLLGVTAVCATGCIMAWRRIKRDFQLMRHRPATGKQRLNSARVTGKIGLFMVLLPGLIACSNDSEEPEDWIEVPLSEATYFGSDSEYREGEYEILVLRNTALEYKLGMNKGQSLSYRWTVDMARPELLTAEFHGHTHRVGEEPGTVMFYKIHQDGEEQGSLVAPFDGIHGWYFDNNSDEDITINLRAAGFFEVLE
jgi:uncharacterized iron-regulated membrane protein